MLHNLQGRSALAENMPSSLATDVLRNLFIKGFMEREREREREREHLRGVGGQGMVVFSALRY